MKSRFRLARVIWTAFFIVFVVCAMELVVLSQLGNQVEEVAEQNRVSRTLARQTSRLLAISHSVATSPSPTNTEQWRLGLKEIKDQVALLQALIHDADLMNELTQKADGLDELFLGLISLENIQSQALKDRRQEVLSARLISEVQQITEVAYVLNEESYLARENLSKKRRQLQLVASVTYALFLLLLMYLIQRRMLRPLRRVADVAEEMKAGNFQARCKLPPGDELGDIAVVMNDLAEKLGLRIHQFNEANSALKAEVFRKVQSEARLEEALSRLHSTSTLLKAAGRMTGVGGWSVEVATNKLTWSEQTYAIVEADLDYQPTLEEAVALYDGEDARQRISDALAEAATTGKTIEMELPFVTMKGRKIWVQVYGEVLYADQNGQQVPEFIFGAFQEITARRMSEIELRRAMEEAQSASKAKGDFLASMSHEIRTPINAIVGLAYMLKQTSLDGEQRSLLLQLEGAGNSLIELVTDILDLSKIESGNMELESREFSMMELLDTMAGIVAGSKLSPDVEFLIFPDPDMPEYCIGDGTKLKQVLVNLLGNAVKFTLKGRIEFHMDLLSQTNESVTVAFRLKDTGIGMTPETIGRLFQVFSQGDSSISRRFGGTGIGLALSQNIVRKMGGEIVVNSELNLGSEFSFQLTLQPSDRKAMPVPNGLEPVLLFVEDNSHQWKAMSQLSRRFGWAAHLAHNVQEAMDQLPRLIQSKPDQDILVLVDQSLDSIDQEISTLLGKLPELRPKQPVAGVLMLSGDDITKWSKADALAGKHHARTVKPMTPSALFNVVLYAFPDRQGVDTKPTHAPSNGSTMVKERLQGIRLLAVDDNALNLSILKGILTKHGAEVVLANNGQQAVDIVQREHANLDLCLMDVQMPIMNGLDACTYIHETLELPDFPVVALTAGAMLSEHSKAIEAGMSGVLTKPLEIEKVIETVNLFRRRSVS